MNITTSTILCALLFLVGLSPVSGQITYSVCSGSPSMGGEFYKGRLIAIVPFEYAKIKTGMLVARKAFNRKGVVVSFVAHRARYKEGPLWVLQGDNFLTNPRPDAIRLSPDNFAGIVCDPKTLKPL